MITKKYRAGSNGESVSNQQLFMAALDMDGQSETNKSPASTQHAGLFLEGASSPSHKKRHCLTAMSLFASSHKKKTLPFGDVSVRVLSQKKTLPFGDVSVRVLSQKKTLPFGDVSFWVPGRTRTVDIQNHKQTCECLINPVFIGVSAIFDFLFAAILRLFTQGPILFQ